MEKHNIPEIAIAGLGIEASTFSPARTDAAAFHPHRGDEVFDLYPFMSPGSPLREAAHWHPALVGKALPGGIVTREGFEELTAEMVQRLEAMPHLDGLWFDIHGAMTVEGLDDAESVLLSRIRDCVGPDTLISTSMDLHGNVSQRFAHMIDLITCYRMAPHEDAMDTKERAARNLVERLESGKGRPIKAWIPVPVLLPGEKTSTRIEPAKSLYAQVPLVEQQEEILDAGIWIGYAWADEPRNHAAIVVTGDDERTVCEQAERLASSFWSVHDSFQFVAPTGTLEECVDKGLSSQVSPYFISDSGDNPTAGGAGDVTWTLQRLLNDPRIIDGDKTTLYASIPGPQAVETALHAGVGATVTVTAGAEVDSIHEGPVTFTGTVHSIHEGDVDALVEVVIKVGNLYVIVTELRKPYHHESDFTALGLNPREAGMVFVKIGYLEPELFEMARDWIMALTPGGVDQDLLRLGHHRISHPMYPFDQGDFTPDLHARIIPPSNEGDTVHGDE
ncbi:M81 family metallopeptidase [Bifidobacterium sp.]|uniref:M81 family metallopeptidase n=1 Tax=Bifidobacterium sp. TaxID=41200 RepID=UPI0039E95079